MGTKAKDRITRAEAKAARAVLRKVGGVKKTEDVKPKSRRTPRVVGKNSGLGICDFWVNLFLVNEVLPKKRKMTDEEIKRQVLTEFAEYVRKGRESLVKLGRVGERGQVSVNEHRILYNRGSYTRGKLPAVMSMRYGIDGNIVDARTGRRVLTPDEVASERKSHAERIGLSRQTD